MRQRRELASGRRHNVTLYTIWAIPRQRNVGSRGPVGRTTALRGPAGESGLRRPEHSPDPRTLAPVESKAVDWRLARECSNPCSREQSMSARRINSASIAAVSFVLSFTIAGSAVGAQADMKPVNDP